jgi:hypothetical protein
MARWRLWTRCLLEIHVTFRLRLSCDIQLHKYAVHINRELDDKFHPQKCSVLPQMPLKGSNNDFRYFRNMICHQELLAWLCSDRYGSLVYLSSDTVQQ